MSFKFGFAGRSVLFLLLVLNFHSASAVERSESQSSLAVESVESGISLALGPSIAVMGGQMGWGFGVSLDHPIVDGLPIYMGIDLGFRRFSSFENSDPVNGVSTFSTVRDLSLIEVLPTFYYSFYVPGVLGVFPFLGFSVGPTLALATGQRGTGFTEDESNLYLQTYVRPGVAMFMTDSISVQLEPKFGWLRNYFVFLPQLNLAVSL